MSVEIFIPVMGYSVEVMPNGGRMSLVEQAAVLFVHAHENALEGEPKGIAELSAFLQLDENTTFDLVLDMWRKDRITIDPRTGKLSVSAEVAEAIKAEGDALEKLGTTEQPVVAQMLFDVVAGSTLPLTWSADPRDTAPRRARFPRNRREPGEPYSAYPQDLEGFRHLDRDELADALSRHPLVKQRNGRSDIFSYTVLEPDEKRTLGHVRYLGVFFDLSLTDRRLTAVPNDSRAIRMILGNRIARDIMETYADLKDEDSEFARFIEERAQEQHADLIAHASAIESFLKRAEEMDGQGEHWQRRRLTDLWWDARAQLAQTAHKRGFEVSHAHRAADIRSLVREISESSEGELVVGLPMDGNKPGGAEAARNTILTSFLEGGPPRRLGLQLGSDVKADRLHPDLVRAGEADKDAEVRAAIVSFSKPESGPSGPLGVNKYRPNALASPVVGGSRGLVLLNGSVLSGTSTQAIALQSRDDTPGDRLGFGRLRMRFEGLFERRETMEGNNEAFTGFDSAPEEILDLVERLDAAFEPLAEDDPEADPQADDTPEDPEGVVRGNLLLSEQVELAKRLADWSLFEAESAEACFGGDIFTWTTTLLRLAPADAPVCIGLSDFFDWKPDPAFLSALSMLRERQRTERGQTIVFLPPKTGDHGKNDEVDALFHRLVEFHPGLKRQTLPEPGDGQYSLGFVAGPGFGVFARRGIARRSENHGRKAFGLVTGIRVGGRQNAISAAAGLGLPAVDQQVAVEIAPKMRMVPRLFELFQKWKDNDPKGLEELLSLQGSSAREALPGDIPEEFVRVLLRAEARLEGRQPAFEGAREKIAEEMARQSPVTAAAVFGPMIDAAYEDLTMQNVALAVATGCDLPPGLDVFALLNDGEAAKTLTARLLVATLLAQGAHTGLVEALGDWRQARRQAGSEPEATLDRLIDALLDMRVTDPACRLSGRIGFVSDRRQPETAWQMLEEHLLGQARSKRSPVFFTEFLFNERKDADAPFTARLSHVIKRTPDVWHAEAALKRILPAGQTFNTLSNRKAAGKALEKMFEPAVKDWLRSGMRPNERKKDRVEPYGDSRRQYLDTLAKTADLLSDVAFALSDAGRDMRNERALAAAIEALEALDPPEQKSHRRTLWDGLLAWLSEDAAPEPRRPWTVCELIAKSETAEDRIATVLARDDAESLKGLSGIFDDLVEAERFEDLRALCHALTRLDNRDMPEGEREQAAGYLQDGVQQWIAGRKRAVDATYSRFTLFGLSLEMKDFKNAMETAATGRDATAAPMWTDDKQIDDLSMLSSVANDMMEKARATIRNEARELGETVANAEVRKILRIDDADSSAARLDFAKWLSDTGANLSAPELRTEKPTLYWLQGLSRKPSDWDEAPVRDDAMLSWLKHCLSDEISDLAQAEAFARNLVEFIDLAHAEWRVDRVATGWRVRIDGDGALELAPHLFTGDETGVEIFVRGAHLRIGDGDADRNGNDDDRAQRIRLTMTTDWTPASGRDRLSLGDIVPAAFEAIGERRKRIAERLIARSDALKDWWPGTPSTSDDRAADDARWRKLRVLLGKPQEDLDRQPMPALLSELFGDIPTKNVGDDRYLQFRIIAFQAGGSLLNAMDLLFDGVRLRSDGTSNRRMLRSPEDLFYREPSKTMARRLIDRALPGMRDALERSGADIHELSVSLALPNDEERSSVQALAKALDGLVALKEGYKLETLLGELLAAGWLEKDPTHQAIRQRESDGISYLVLTSQ